MGKLVKRNVWCGKYNECLDQAIETGEPFDCEGCEFEYNQDGKDGVTDMFGVCLLFVAIHFPRVYQTYRRYQHQRDEKTRIELERLINELRQDRNKGILKKLFDRFG